MSGPSIPPELIPYLTHEKTDNSSVQHSIVLVNSVFLALIWSTTGARFWVRFQMLRSAGLDDILIILALIFATLLSISSLIGESFGLGKHLWNLSAALTGIASETGKVTKSLYGSYLSYSTAITFTKFSIMATYIRIFPCVRVRKIVYCTGIVVLCFWIASIFAIIFTCIPVQAAWNYSINGHCFPIVNFFYASSAFNIVTDILLCVLPIQPLWALNLPKPQRMVLIVLFSMGTFACVASILRLTHLKNLGAGIDITYQTVSSLNWSVVEVDTGILCASLSSLRPLARRFVPKLFGTSSRSSSPTEKELTAPQTPYISTSTSAHGWSSRFLPPPPKICSFNAKMCRIPTMRRSSSANSITSVKSEIYVQKSFEVVQTMKDLPDPFCSTSRIADMGEMAPVQAPRSIFKPKSRVDCDYVEEYEGGMELEVPQRMSREERGEVKGEGWDQKPPTLKWPSRALTKGIREEEDGQSKRLSVMGMFTTDLLDFTSSEDEGRSSEDTIRGAVEVERGRT